MWEPGKHTFFGDLSFTASDFYIFQYANHPVKFSQLVH